jgi:glyoxylase-like metal-dependent hydrolase (beta-lactamase superfamily II)
MIKNTLLATLVILASLAGISTALASQHKDEVNIETQIVREGIYILTGQGGNIGLSSGVDGVFMIDDQFAPLTEKIKQAIKKISKHPVHFLLNTHWHPDHTGGNENFGNTGSVIIAQANVRKRLSVDNFIELFGMETPAATGAALPVITFNDAITFYLNDDEISVFHVKNAHTDGDSIIHFRNTNVFHMGDTYFAGMYPFIDYDTGGSLEGCIVAIDKVLALTNEDTRIIPGHGPLSNKTELVEYRTMLAMIGQRIQRMIDSGKSLEEVQKSQPARGFNAAFGGGFINSGTFVKMLYEGMKQAL